jgi:hypothetical protein
MNIDDLAPRIFEEAHDNALPRTFLSRPVPSKKGGRGSDFSGARKPGDGSSLRKF